MKLSRQQWNPNRCFSVENKFTQIWLISRYLHIPWLLHYIYSKCQVITFDREVAFLHFSLVPVKFMFSKNSQLGQILGPAGRSTWCFDFSDSVRHLKTCWLQICFIDSSYPHTDIPTSILSNKLYFYHRIFKFKYLLRLAAFTAENTDSTWYSFNVLNMNWKYSDKPNIYFQ